MPMKMVVLGSLCGLEKEMHVGKGTIDDLFSIGIPHHHTKMVMGFETIPYCNWRWLLLLLHNFV
jgi:hypothetical protein